MMASVLDIKMQENDAGAETIRDYFKALLKTLWEENESFSGKRPFGNSDWDYELYHALVKGGVIKGEIDEYDCLDTFDERKANKAIFDAIDELCARKEQST